MKFFLFILTTLILSTTTYSKNESAEIIFDRENIKMEDGKCKVDDTLSSYKDSPCEMLYPKADNAGGVIAVSAELNSEK